MSSDTADTYFGRALKRTRESKGLSMSQLADLLARRGLRNIYPTTVGRIERAERPVKLSEAIAISQTLGVSLEAMIADAYLSEDEPTPTESALWSLRAVQRAQKAIEQAAQEQRWLIHEAQNRLLGLPAPIPHGEDAEAREAARRWYSPAPGEDSLDAVFDHGGYINAAGDDDPHTTK